MYQQDAIVKIAQQVVRNRLAQNYVLRKLAAEQLPDPIPEGNLPARATEAAAKAERNIWQALEKLLGKAGPGLTTVKNIAGKVWNNPPGRFATITGGAGATTLGLYGLYNLLAGGGSKPTVPAAPVVSAPSAPIISAPVAPPAPVVSAPIEPPSYVAPAPSVAPMSAPVGGAASDSAGFLDVLRAYQPFVGATVGALGGAATGAGVSRKNRVRNALIGLVAGAALGGGTGYLTQGRI